MKTKPVTMTSIILLGCLLQTTVADQDAIGAQPSGKTATLALSQLPMTFEAMANSGGKAFAARGAGYRLSLSAGAASFYFSGGEMLVRLAGANPAAKMLAQEPAPGRANYFIGNDPSLWRRQVAQYRRVECPSVYPGIDLVYRGTQRQLEYDFVVAPGADPGQIRMVFSNADRVEIDDRGDLLAHAPGGAFCHHRPVVYQEIDGNRRMVDAAFALDGDGSGQSPSVQFKIGDYDRNHPLVIDPVLSFSTFLGGSGDDQAFGVAVDRAGSIYVAGQTASADFPTAKPLRKGLLGGYDLFVAKYNQAGTALEYSTYIGGGGVDRAFCLATDADGNAVVAGVTFSTNFPTVNAFQPAFGGGDRDGFVLKLNSSGNEIAFSTYLGGAGSDEIACAALDSAGNICVGGHTSSANFPLFNAYQSANRGKFDALVAKFDPSGVLVFSTYLGGSGPYDCAVGIATDALDNILLTGYTSSPDFPSVKPIQSKSAGGYDVFVSKFNSKGTELQFSSWLGGSSDDVGRSIAVDKSGAVYVSGDTFSTNFPTVNPFQKASAGKRDVFVAKLDLQTPKIVYSTYFGGSGEELASLATDPAGCVHLIGLTTSRDLPTANPMQAAFGGGVWDAFVVKFNAAGAGLEFSSYLGGNGNDQGAAITLDDAGNIYVAGATASHDFMTLQPVQGKYGGGMFDAFVAKITPTPAQKIVKEIVEPKKEETPPVVAATPLTPATPVIQTTPVPAEKIVTEVVEPKKEATPAVVAATPLAPSTPPVQTTPAATEKIVTEVVEPKKEATPAVVAATPLTPATPAAQSVPITQTNAVETKKIEKPAAESVKPESAQSAAMTSISTWSTNLLVNGGAEAGAPANSSYKVAPVPGWITTNNLTVLRYGTAGGFPDTNTAGPADRGRNFFVGGPDNAESSATQTIDLSQSSDPIDQNKTSFKCLAYLGGMGGQNDYASVQLVFKSAEGLPLGQAVAGPVTLADRQYKTLLLQKIVTGLVPAKTRSVDVILRMKRVQGAYNDAFADEIQFMVGGGALKQ